MRSKFFLIFNFCCFLSERYYLNQFNFVRAPRVQSTSNNSLCPTLWKALDKSKKINNYLFTFINRFNKLHACCHRKAYVTACDKPCSLSKSSLVSRNWASWLKTKLLLRSGNNSYTEMTVQIQVTWFIRDWLKRRIHLTLFSNHQLNKN